MDRAIRILAAVFLAVPFLGTPSFAAVITSNGSGGGNWSAGATWSGGNVPQAADDVVIAAGDTITVDSAQTANSVTLANHTTNKSLLMATGGLLTINGSGSALAVNPTGTVQFDGGTIALSSGDVTVNGAFSGDGKIDFGANGGTLNIGGSLNFAGAGGHAQLTASNGGGSSTVRIGKNLGSGGQITTDSTFIFNGTGAQSIGGPYEFEAVEINNAGTTQLAAPLTVNSSLKVTAGTFSTSPHALTVFGDIITSGTLNAGSSTISWAGAWTNTGALNTAGATIQADGGGPQLFSSTSAAQFRTVTINNPFDVTISGDNSVLNVLNLKGGNIIVGGTGFSIAQACVVNRNTGHFIGPLTMGFNASQKRTFYVGTTTSELPIDVTAGGAGNVVAAAVEGLHPNRTGDNTLSGYWRFPVGSTVTSLSSVTFHYAAGDVAAGNEARFVLARYHAGVWTQFGDVVNEITHNATATAVVPDGSDWVIGQRGSTGAAATVAISAGGQVSANVPFNVVVQATDDNGNPAVLTTSTNVALHRISGTGTLGGTTSGTIPAGASSTTITGVTYDKRETIALNATASGGEPLDPGPEVLFDVRRSTITVTTTAESGPGSFREAITTAVSNGCDRPCTINFAPSGTGTILLTYPLPIIEGFAFDLTVDGYTAAGASPNTAPFGAPSNANVTVIIDGEGGAALASGLEINSQNVTIRGLAFRSFYTQAIRVTGTLNTIGGCLIGTGTPATSNQTGIVVAAGESNAIGGPAPAARNVISGNRTWGVIILSSRNAVEGNYIGVNAAGTVAMGNLAGGLKIVDGLQNNIVGNVISGHVNGPGVEVNGLINQVSNNRIGTDASGTVAVPNLIGIRALKQGGIGENGGNIVSGNIGVGILIDPDGWVHVRNNRIGVGATMGALGNGEHGVSIVGTGTQVSVAQNVIANNGGDGVSVTSTGTGTLIRLNDLYANAGLPIDLGDDGPTPNDPGDADASRQNFPTISAATSDGSVVRVTASLDSSQWVAPPRFFIIDVYKVGPAKLEYLGASGFLPGPVLSNYTFDVPAGSAITGDAIVTLATSYADNSDELTALKGTSELSPSFTLGGVKHWIAANGTWETAGSWLPVGVPTATDTVLIDNPGTYTVTINSAAVAKTLTVGGAAGAQTLSVTAGNSLSVLSTAGVTAGDALTVDGSTNAGALDVSGTLNWRSGTIAGAGALTIQSGGALNLSTNATKTLDQRALTVQNGATVNWTGGTFQLKNAASVANAGTIEVQTNTPVTNGGGAGVFTNSGTFHKSGAAGTTTFDNVAFNHSGGLVHVDSGVLELAGGGTANARIDLAAGTELLISASAYHLGNGASVTSFGLVHVSTGELDVDAAMNIRNVVLENGGTVAGSGLLLYGTFLWNGGTMGGTGTTEGPAASTITLATGLPKSLNRTLLILSGGSAAVTGAGTISLGTGGAISNAGTWGSQTDYAFINGGSAGPFTNSGTFRKSLGAGLVAVGVDFNNAGGAVDVQSGGLQLESGTSTGPFTLAASTTVEIVENGKTYTLATGASAMGAGTIVVSGFGTLGINTAISISKLNLSGGIIAGPGTLTLTGTATWSAGSMQNGGRTVIANGATLDIAGPQVFLEGRTLDILNGGTVHWTSGKITMGHGSPINNAGLFYAQVDDRIENLGAGPFTNTGELRSTGNLTIGVPIANTTGTVNLQSGVLTTAGGYTQAAGGTLKISLGGTTAGSEHGKLFTQDPPTFGGTLQIVLAGAYQPASGEMYEVIAIGSGFHNGDFAHPYTYPALAGGRTFADAYELTGLILRVIGAPDLSIVKTASATSVAAGTPIRYTLAVHNGGSEPAFNAQVTDTLPFGHFGITANGGPAWNCGVVGDTVTCNAIAPLLSGNAQNIVIDAIAPQNEQTFTNTAHITSANDPNGANDSSSVNVTVGSNQADLFLTGTGPAPVPTSSTLSIGYTVINNGPQMATFVNLRATIPPLLTYSSASIPGGNCTFSTPFLTCTLPALFPNVPITATINLITTVSGIADVVADVSGDQQDPFAPNNTLTYRITVTNNTIHIGNANDSGPGSLRQALLDAAGGVCPAPCAIVFNIPGSSPFQIHLQTPLPNIPSGVTIDASTQAGYVNTPLLEIDGSSVQGSPIFNVTGDGSTLRALSIINGGVGVKLTGNNNLIESCFIGVSSSFQAAPNQIGIQILGGGNTIGGHTATQNPIAPVRTLGTPQAASATSGNVIANNTAGGVVVTGGSGNEITGNSISNNASPGIDLGGDGPDGIDAGDSDGGPNGKQNSPTLLSATLANPGNLTIRYSLNSSATAAHSMLVQFFEADSAGSGEGKTLLGGTCVASNNFNNSISFAAPGIAAGDPIVATATSFTDNGCTTVGDGTSEFSNVVAAAPCAPPSANVSGSTAICAGGSATISATLTGTPPFNVTWSDGPSQTIASGTTASRIISPAGTTTYTITSITDAGCGGAGTSTGGAIIAVSPNPIATITAPATVNPGSAGNIASVPAQGGATYIWMITNGNITAGAGTNVITFTAGPSGSVILNVMVVAGSCSSTGTGTVSNAGAIPTMSEWMLLALAMTLAALGALRMR